MSRLDEIKGMRQAGFVVVYINDDDLYASETFSNYDDALAFTTSEEGAGENKAIIVAAGSGCGMQEFEMDWEPHT